MEKKKRVEQLSSVQNPEKVKVLILADQKTSYSDFYFITKFVNIVKIDLSYNQLSNFSVGFTFSAFHHLRILFLHYNKFTSIKNLEIICQSPSIEYLTLFGNPLEQTKIRHYFVNQLPNLKLMDEKIVKMSERCPEILINNNEQFIKLPFPIVKTTQYEGSSLFLAAVATELHLIRSKYILANPHIRIQREFKRWLKIRRIKDRKYKIETEEQNKEEKAVHNQKLVTQKLQKYVPVQSKILSLFQMNSDFLNFLRLQSKQPVYSTKKFCQLHHIKFFQQQQNIFCLRVPKQYDRLNKVNLLQFIIKSGQRWLVRRRGSDESQGFRKKFKFLATLLKKRNRRQPIYKDIETDSVKYDQKLLEKMDQVYWKYSENLVQIAEPQQKKYELLKEHYFCSNRESKIYPFLMGGLLNRIVAATSIQRMWRGYSSRRKKGNFYEMSTIDNSTWLIQRFIRNLAFRKRHKMYIDLIDYAKKQAGSDQIILQMDEIKSIVECYTRVIKSSNFALPQQKVEVCFQKESQQVYIKKKKDVCIGKKFLEVSYIPQREYAAQGRTNFNILDILFCGVKQVKYFSVSSAHMKISKGKNLKSFTKISFADKDEEKDGKLLNFVKFQYENSIEAIKRKSLLALLSFRIINFSFVRSHMFYLNQNGPIKNISHNIKDGYFIMRAQNENKVVELPQNSRQNLTKSYKQNKLRLKFFSQQQDYSTDLKIFYPYQTSPNQYSSLSLPLQKLLLDRAPSNLRNSVSKNESLNSSAHISRQVITLVPTESPSQSQFLKYNQFEQYQKKSQNRYLYQDKEYFTNRQKSLEKSQSLKGNSHKKEVHSINFKTENKNLHQINLQSLTENLRMGSKNQYEQSVLTGSMIADQDLGRKKQRISLIKQSHRSRMEEKIKQKQVQLSKIKIKNVDQIEELAKRMEDNNCQRLLYNEKKVEMVKRALTKQFEESQDFQKRFIKRGNSSIRKDMIKFEHLRSSKSPDSQSVYESLKSLQAELFKNQLKQRSKRLFNMKTDIKQFSIAGSDQFSLGIFDHQTKEIGSKRYQNLDQKEVKQQKKEERQKQKKKKKQARKKRLVHSVFPEELYPLKQVKKVGFQLPKINKK